MHLIFHENYSTEAHLDLNFFAIDRLSTGQSTGDLKKNQQTGSLTTWEKKSIDFNIADDE